MTCPSDKKNKQHNSYANWENEKAHFNKLLTYCECIMLHSCDYGPKLILIYALLGALVKSLRILMTKVSEQSFCHKLTKNNNKLTIKFNRTTFCSKFRFYPSVKDYPKTGKRKHNPAGELNFYSSQIDLNPYNF